MTIQVGSRSFASVQDLEKLVIHAATEYELHGYVEDFDGVEVTDPEYDELVKRLRVELPTSKAFKGTSPSKAKTKGATVKHDPPMTSIAKSDGTDEEKRAIYEKWLADCAARLNVPVAKLPIAQSYKRDGVALRVNYVNGELVSAGLRPRNGIDGSDVTRHMKYIQGVPQTLRLPLTLSLNGEIECWLADFEAVNREREAAGEDLYKNPRNYTAGCLGRDDPEENKNARLRISWYGITGFDDWGTYYRTEVERAKFVNTKAGLGLQDGKGNGFYVQVLPHTKYEQLGMMEEHAKKLAYYTDGVVLKVDDLEDQEELGHVGDDPVNDPRGALAWKYTEQKAEAVVSRIEWNASRTGRVVPTAIFDEPFVLQDTSNSRATCNNYGWMEKNGLGPGAVAICKKGGKIIPNICGVKTPVKTIGAPTQCPTCNAKLTLNVSSSGNKDLLCPNKSCGAKQIQSWLHYFRKLGAKGLGPSAMEQLLAGGKVKSLSDFYKLTEVNLQQSGFSEREGLLALATIWMVPADDDDVELRKAIAAAQKKKIKVQGWVFFAALGIPGAGETAGKALVQHFKDFTKIQQASTDELLEVSGIGETTAEAIHSWFDQEGYNLVDELLEYFELELPKVGKLTGKNFCLTGDFAKGKPFWKKQIEALGGNCQSSVSSKTHYCVHDESTGTGSEKKALTLGIPVITPKELEKML